MAKLIRMVEKEKHSKKFTLNRRLTLNYRQIIEELLIRKKSYRKIGKILKILNPEF